MYREMPHFEPDEILVYLRKSRSDDPALTVEEVLEKHTKDLNDWIERNLDGQVSDENWYKEIASAETIEGRPELQKILKRMEHPKIRALLVIDVQRISRGDMECCGRIMKLLRFTHTKVITPMKIYDLEDEYDRDAFERELKRGNDYLEYFKKIQKRGIERSLMDGNFIYGAPYGYRNVKAGTGREKYHTLEINEDEAKIVRMIFNWSATERIGAMRVADRLNEMGIKSPRGKLWRKDTIRKMLSNEHYIGKVVYKRRQISHVVENQEIVKKRLRNDEYQVFEGKHEPIIDEALFYQVQKEKPSIPRCKRSAPMRNPFVNILRCECGAHMEIHYHRKKWRLTCSNQTHCHNSSVLLSDLTEEVCKVLKKCIDDFQVELDSNNDDAYQTYMDQVALLESRLKEVEEKELAIWEKYSEEGMPKHIFERLRSKCEDEKKALEKAIENAYENMPSKIDYQEKIATFHKALDMLNDESVPTIAKNTLLKTIIERISYKRPLAIRMSPSEAEEKGVVTNNGWYTPDFELDISLFF